MDTYEEERTPQEAAEDRRSLKIGRAVSDATKIKFDRVRTFDFKTPVIIQMERTLHRKSWEIVQEFTHGGWSHEELMAVLWAGLLHTNQDMTPQDAWAIFDATPIKERPAAVIALVKTLTRALGAGEEIRMEDKE
jgi:hypothetical protein